MVLGEATAELLAPCCRMVQLLDTPQDLAFFGKLLQREIIYRLLQGPQGRPPAFGCYDLGGPKSSNSKGGQLAARELRERALNVDDLASISGMSRSTLHHHFRPASLSMSPFAVSKAASAHTARQEDAHGGARCREAQLSRLGMRPQPVQSGVQTVLRPTANARYSRASNSP